MLERRKAERRRPLPMSDRDLVGHFCRIPDGQRVFVESVCNFPGGGTSNALYRYIEGPNIGQPASSAASTLKVLGKVIPVQEI
jgi:hypothetical protein